MGGMPGMGGAGGPSMGGMPGMGGAGGPSMGGMPGKGGAGGPGMGGMPGMAGMGGPGAGEGAGKAPEPPSGVNGSVSGTTLSSATITTINLKGLPGPMYETVMEVLRSTIAQARGSAEAFVPYNGIHDLAAALKSYSDQKKAFPRGAFDGADRPDLRYSWLVSVVPMLPGSNLAPQVEPLLSKPGSWRNPAGLALATMHMPAFVNTVDATGSSRVQLTSVGETLGATHFVGVGGLGLDSPSLAATPASQSKLGVFGYDRTTQMKDITDGPANTIAVLMVPSSSQGAWIAGGGGTVRGIATEGNPLEPFLLPSALNPKTKAKERGTYAIMADGKIRFLPASLPPATFMALCTIAGGEKVDNLDDLAPLVGPGGHAPLVATPAPGTPMPSGSAAPAPIAAVSVQPGVYKVVTELRRQGSPPQKNDGAMIVSKVGTYLAFIDPSGKDRRTFTDLLVNTGAGRLDILERAVNPKDSLVKQALVVDGAGLKYTATIQVVENGIPSAVEQIMHLSRNPVPPKIADPGKNFLSKELYSCEKIDNLTLPEGVTQEQVVAATRAQILALENNIAVVALQVFNTASPMSKPTVAYFIALSLPGYKDGKAVSFRSFATPLPELEAKVTEEGKFDLHMGTTVISLAKPVPPPAPEGEAKPEGETKPEGEAKPSDSAVKPADAAKPPDTAKPSDAVKPADTPKPPDAVKPPDTANPPGAGKAPGTP